MSSLFNTLLSTVHNMSTGGLAIDTQIITVYLEVLPYLKHFTFFPLLMKTVFDTSLMLCNRHVRGFCNQPYYALETFFSFMIASLDRFE